MLERVADEDSTVATEAARVFSSFAPFDENDRLALFNGLSHSKVTVRLTAVTSLASDTPDAASALKWFQFRVADMDPRVRAKAIEALAKWGPKVKACLPDLLKRIDDDTPAIAVAAVKAATVVDGGPMVAEALGRLLRSVDARPDVKTAAVEALLTIDLSNAETDVPILVLLLDREKAETRAAALAKLAKFGKGAKLALGSISDRLKDDDDGVKLAALKVLDTFGRDCGDAIPRVAELLDGKQSDAVAVEAATTIAKLGPKAIEPLTKALGSKLPKDALVQVCEGLGSFGKDAESAGPALLEAVINQKSLNSLATEATGAALAMKPWVPDPVATALSKIGGGDKVATELTDWSSFELKPINGVNRRVAKRGDGVMLWAILVLNSIDPDSLTMKVKAQVASQLGILVSYAPTQVCKDAAKVAQKKYSLNKK